MIQGLRRWSSVAVGAAWLGLTAACGLQFTLGAEARDQWKKTYTLTDGGSLEIHDTNGRIEIRTGDGNTVDVVADRVVNATTDEAAHDALNRLEIAETVSPDRVVLDAATHSLGFQFHLSQRVDFVVHVPRSTAVKLVSTNGNIDVADLGGSFRVETTNGKVKATGLSNSASVSSTNGAIALEFAKLGDDGITCDTTNGAIQISIPRDSKARVSARVTNGTIATSDLELAASEQSRHRLDATIGGGGPAIRLETTNCLIELKGK